MRFQQIDDLLEWAASFHQKLAGIYANSAKAGTSERLAMLLDYLAQHQQALSQSISRFREDANPALLATWYDQAPEVELPSCHDDLVDRLRQASNAEVVRMALAFHNQLIDLYHYLGQRAPTDISRDLFADLAQMESQEEQRMVRDAGELEDL